MFILNFLSIDFLQQLTDLIKSIVLKESLGKVRQIINGCKYQKRCNVMLCGQAYKCILLSSRTASQIKISRPGCQKAAEAVLGTRPRREVIVTSQLAREIENIHT